jgi:hypothetical protein
MSWSKELLSKEAATAGVAILLLYVIGVIIQRLYFSPVAKFPGPKLAAATFWYEFYFDVIQRGQYGWQIQKMHQKYGRSNAAGVIQRSSIAEILFSLYFII